MKKCYYALMVMLMALVSVGFTACGDDDEPKVADIVGTWQYISPDDMLDDVGLLLLQFTKDGKFHQVINYIGANGASDYIVFHGSYTVKGYKLAVTLDPSPFLTGESETLEFSYSVDGDELELLMDREIVTFTRVRASVIEPYL